MLKLCDKTGWTYSFNKTNLGSLLKLSWSSDSTICAGAGVNFVTIREMVKCYLRIFLIKC